MAATQVEAGAAVTLGDVGSGPRGGFWGKDGNILFAAQQTPVMRVSSSGGTPVPATELDKGGSEVTNRFAQLLPGKALSAIFQRGLPTARHRIPDYIE